MRHRQKRFTDFNNLHRSMIRPRLKFSFCWRVVLVGTVDQVNPLYRNVLTKAETMALECSRYRFTTEACATITEVTNVREFIDVG